MEEVSFAFAKCIMFLFFKYIFKDSDVAKLGRIFPVYSKKDTL